MPTDIFERTKSQTRLWAIVEIIDGELIIFPVADSDSERAAILKALRLKSRGRRER